MGQKGEEEQIRAAAMNNFTMLGIYYKHYFSSSQHVSINTSIWWKKP